MRKIKHFLLICWILLTFNINILEKIRGIEFLYKFKNGGRFIILTNRFSIIYFNCLFIITGLRLNFNYRGSTSIINRRLRLQS